jgi:hypothetical protein
MFSTVPEKKKIKLAICTTYLPVVPLCFRGARVQGGMAYSFCGQEENTLYHIVFILVFLYLKI